MGAQGDGIPGNKKGKVERGNSKADKFTEVE